MTSTEMTKAYVGGTEVDKIYLGETLVYPTTVSAWSVTPASISMGISGGTERIKIEALDSWTISSSENWITFSQNSGDSGRTMVTATIAANNSTARTATITVEDTGQTTAFTISVSQEALPFSVSPSALTAFINAETLNLTIASPLAWTATSSESWAVLSTGSGLNGITTITVSVPDYAGDSARTATITVTNGTNTSAITLEQKIAEQLPSKPFLFNYNAKRYDISTQKLAKEQGQLFDNDLIMDTGRITAGTDYLDLNGNVTANTWHYTNASLNPFNRTSADSEFTFIYKTSGFTNAGNAKLFANRQAWTSAGQSKGDCHNYLIASNGVFGFDGDFAPSNNPQYMVIRAFANNSGLQEEVDVNGNVIQSAATPFVAWDDPSAGIGFFTGGYNYTGSSECFASRFYWMYCANVALTDAEVLQVIRHNEGTLTPPQPTQRTLNIIPPSLGSVSDESILIYIDDLFELTVHNEYDENQGDFSPVFSEVIQDTAYTATYDNNNGYFVVTGPFEEDEYTIYCTQYNSNCYGQINDTITFTGSTEEVNFTDLEMTCEEPEDPCSDWEGNGYSSEEDCRCQVYGDCGEEPEPEPEE